MINQFLDKKHIIKRKKTTRNIIIFSLFFIVFVLGVSSIFSPLSNYIGRPIWQVKNFIVTSFSNLDYLIRSKESLLNDNNNLAQENLNIRLSMIDYQILKDENEKLKEILGRTPVASNFILGNVLVKPGSSLYDTLIIDIGENLNIKEGDIVYALGDTPIGDIGRVYADTSLVTLYTNPGKKTEGFIEGVNASVELIGRGGGNFEMVTSPELQVEKGNIIYLPGDTSRVIAKVEEIISKPSEPFKKVILSSPINIQDIKFVQIKKY